MSVLLALTLDWLFGEPRGAWHPVAWMGRYLSWAGKGLTKLSPARAFWAGTAWWWIGALCVVGLAFVSTRALAQLPWWAEWPLMAVLVKPTFAFRMLITEVSAVEKELTLSLNEGRARLAFIVSRNVSQLSADQVRESAIESLSENLSDSVVAPLFWYVVAGLPGAALYRFANTADAMWGYRGDWEWAGKWAARFDDLANWIPARITGLCLLGGAWGKGGLRALWHEAAKTPSPNSGWPMAALALSLGVRLGKPGVYVLNPTGKVLGAEQVHVGLRQAARTGWIVGVIMAGFAALRWEVTRG